MPKWKLRYRCWARDNIREYKFLLLNLHLSLKQKEKKKMVTALPEVKSLHFRILRSLVRSGNTRDRRVSSTTGRVLSPESSQHLHLPQNLDGKVINPSTSSPLYVASKLTCKQINPAKPLSFGHSDFAKSFSLYFILFRFAR
jgi:hypothetical protein